MMPSSLQSQPRFTRKRLCAAVTAVSLGLPAGFATAQDMMTFALEEIVVTAQKREERLQDTPLSVRAFSSEDVYDLSIAQISDVSRFTPNLTTTSGPTGGNDGYYYIRGVGQSDFNAATDPGVGTYVDGVYLGRVIGASLDTLDVERIEVLRGPQGTLFGRNTIGGAISVVTADPKNEFGGKMQVVAGERDKLDGSFTVDLPFSDSVAAKVSFLSRHQDGWGEHVDFDDVTYGDNETVAGRVKLIWEVSPVFDIMYSVDSTYGRGSPAHTVLLDADFSATTPFPGFTGLFVIPPADLNADRSSDIYKSYVSIDPLNNIDVWGNNLTLRWDLGALQVKSITGYRELDSEIAIDFDGTRYKLYDNYFFTDQSQFSQEFQFTGDNLDNRLHWLLGVYYYQEDVAQLGTLNLGTNEGMGPFPSLRYSDSVIVNEQANDLDLKSQAVFGQATYDLTDQWSLTLGLRWTQEEKTQSYDFQVDNTEGVFISLPSLAAAYPAGTVTPTLSPRNPSLTIPTTYTDEWESVTPRISLEYAQTDDLLWYVGYSEGFRSGGFNGRPIPNMMGQFQQVESYDPEKVSTAEAGMKAEFADNRVRMNLAVFHSSYEDIQLLVFADGATTVQNAAEAEIQGVELEVMALATPNLELMAGVGYTDAGYEALDPGAIQEGIQLSDELPVTPEWNANVGIQYTWGLGNAGSFKLRGDYTYQSEVWFQAANNPLDVQEAYGLGSMRGTWLSPSEQLSIAAYVLNIADEEYFLNMSDTRGELGTATAQVGPPREWGMEVLYNF